MRSDGTHRTAVTNNDAQDSWPVISPNGRAVAYASDRKNHQVDVYSSSLDGGDQHRLTNNPAGDFVPSFSPNGKRIAFTRALPSTLEYQICIMRADGSHLRQLTHDPFGGPYQPSFTPDDNRIVFETDGGIDVMRVDGSHRRKLIRTPKADFSPSVSPSGNSIVFVSNGFGSTSELPTARADGTHIHRLTDNKFNERSPNWGPR